MAEPYRIRPARRGDREGIAGLLAVVGYPDSCDTSTLSWVISHPEMEVHVAADPLDHVVGMVSLSHRPQLKLKGRIATLEELIVLPEWRRRGIGKDLLARAVTRVKVLGCKRLELSTLAGPEGAAFLEKLGFARIESTVLRLSELERAR